MTLQRTLLRTLKKSKLLQLREEQLLELHRGKLLSMIIRYGENNGTVSEVYKLFEKAHPGHYAEFKALISDSCDLKKFRHSQVKVYRGFVERLIRQHEEEP